MFRARPEGRQQIRELRTLSLFFSLGLACTTPAAAQNAASAPPPNQITTTFTPAPLLVFPNQTDSNSPLVWIGDELVLFNSVDGHPARAVGAQLQTERSEEDGEPGSTYDDDVGRGR